jgi:hypothetical protein
MLIVLGLFGVGAVIVLSMMAQRYGKLMQQVEPAPASASSTAEPAGAGRAGSIAVLALRHVDAFIEARRAIADGPMAERLSAHPEPGFPLSEVEARRLDRALSDAGLDRATYEGILESYRAWKAGREDLPGPLPAAFEQRREELQRLE